MRRSTPVSQPAAGILPSLIRTPVATATAAVAMTRFVAHTGGLHAGLLPLGGHFGHADGAGHRFGHAGADAEQLASGCWRRALRGIGRCVVLQEPVDGEASADEALGGFVDATKVARCAAGAGHDGKKAAELVAFVVRRILKLSVGQERVEDAEVGVTEGAGGEGEVQKIADDDVDQDAKVVGVKVFVGGGSRE